MYLYLSTRQKLNPVPGMARSGTLSFSSSPCKRTGGHEHHREQAKQSQNLFIAPDDVLMLAISFSVHKVDLCGAIPHGTMAPPHRRSCLHIVPSRAKDILAYGLQPLPNVSSQIGSNFFVADIFPLNGHRKPASWAATDCHGLSWKQKKSTSILRIISTCGKRVTSFPALFAVVIPSISHIIRLRYS